MGKITCPSCGSEDLVDWGTSMRMCRNCHETFSIEDAYIVEEEDANEDDEEFLEMTVEEEERSSSESDDQEDEEHPEENTLEGYLEILPGSNETVNTREDKTESSIYGSDSSEETEGATAQFEDFYAKLKEEQRIEDEQRAAARQARPVEKKRKTDAKKVLPWVIIPIIIWLILTIICLVQ